MALRQVLGFALGAALLPTLAHETLAAEISYGGRVADAAGQPLAGPVDISVRFYASNSGGDPLASSLTFPATELANGVFQLTLKLDDQAVTQIFGDGSSPVYIEIEAAGTIYPRQKFSTVPFALRVPIDNLTLTYGDDGALAIKQVDVSQITGLATAMDDKASASELAGKADATHTHAIGDVTGLAAALAGKADTDAAVSGDVGGFLTATTVDKVKGIPVTTPTTGADNGKYLQYDGSSFVLSAISGASGGTVTNVTASAPLTVTNGSTTPALTLPQAGTGSDGYLSSSDFTVFSAKQAAITPSSTVSAGTVTTAQQNGLQVKPFDTGAGQTGELRFDELAANGTNYVGFKAPDALAASRIWTLPPADGTAGQFLITNGSGVLTWGSPAGGGDMMRAANLSDLTDAAAARSNLGLGALASASAVSAAEITDGTIANADIATTAAIATSKLSGPLTSITGHGLGSLAALSGVSTTEITDGTIADADIATTAAIATSKLSGPVTSIASHGLGSLATLSAVGGTEITDGAIGNDDVSATAAIATSKLSGPVTSIASHGLGSLATLSTVGSTEITDGQIADVDIAGAAAIATSKLSGPLTSIASHGLGSLATLSAVGSTEITDGAIGNDDVSATAAIATSKLSGPVTSIASHGLGSLATLSTVGSTEITDGAIANADVSASAAIATSKLSGSVTSISGHGLGSLASLNGVGSAEINDGTIANADISATAAIATAKISGAVTSIPGHGLGTLATLSTVGSAQITDGQIANADISDSAAITDSKLATISTAGKVANSATTATSDNTANTIVARDASGNFSANALSLNSTMRLGQLASDPTGLAAGDKGLMWFNTTESVVKVWDGSAVQLVNVTNSVPRFTNLTLPEPTAVASPASTGFSLTMDYQIGTTPVYTLDGTSPEATNPNLQLYNGDFVIPWDDASDGTFKFAGYNALFADPSSTTTYVLRTGSALSLSLAFSDNFTDSVTAIGVTSAGASYIAERFSCNCGTQQINRYSSTGSFVGEFGTYGTAAGNLYGPQSVTLDSSGNVYVAENGNSRIQKFNSTGTSQLTWAGFGYLATLNGTTILVASGTTVTKYNTSGVSQGSFSLTGSIRTRGLWADASSIYAATSNGIEIYDSSGVLQSTVTALTSPGGSAIPLSWNGLGKVVRTSGGEFLFIWGSSIVRASSSWEWLSTTYFSSPVDMAIDSSDRVYVANSAGVTRYTLAP